VVVDRDEAALASAASDLRGAGLDVTARAVDLRDDDAVQSLAQEVQGRGAIRYLCANAGVSTAGTPIWATPAEQVEFVLDVNLGGLLRCIRSFVPLLLERPTPASVVVTASMAGLVTTPTGGAYSASKAAVVAVAKALRAELHQVRQDLQVVLLCPGMVSTNLQLTSAAAQPEGGITQEQAEQFHSALDRLGAQPAVVAGWVLDALDHDRFWVLPPADDPFTTMLRAEVSELIGS
jgi:short-subunit dehydrogenase